VTFSFKHSLLILNIIASNVVTGLKYPMYSLSSQEYIQGLESLTSDCTAGM
jgi:hypothetical protein